MVRNRQTAGACGEVLVHAGEACALDVAPSASTQLRRSVLLGTVAAGMLLFGYGRVARAGPGPCVTSGSTATCTGNQSDGIEGGTDFDETIVSTLKVNSLDRDIAPAAGVDGISFFRFGSLTINSNTTDGPGGPFAITTKGDFAYGIHAYSFAGSATVTHIGDIHTSGHYGVGINAAGFRSVRITHTGDISTKGDLADGIYADSYGSVTINQTGNISTTGFFAFGISAGGRSVTVNQTGNITTQGDRSFGIGARAYRGIKVAHTGSITTKGDVAYGIFATTLNGPVSITQTGDISTKGAFADGIYATVGYGNVFVTQKGDITVTGTNADAIDVNHGCGCYGAYGYSLVTIKAGSTITGGPGEGDGIDFDGGLTNRVVNYGTITTLGENAIEGEGPGAEIVDNYGTVTGNVHLGPGANRFNNRSGGVFNSGATAYIGAGNLFWNAGTLSPGGSSVIRTTALTGNMVQTSGGRFALDLNLGNATTDRVNVTGTAKLDGTVKVAVQNPALLKQQFTILSADGGTTDDGLGLIASPALQAVLLFPNANDVVLGIDVDFSPDGLNRNQTAIGNNLNAVLGALGPGGGALGPVYNGLFNVFNLNDYADALDQLSPEIYADLELAAVYSAFNFSDNLLSCHVNGQGVAAINEEGQCFWVGAQGRFIDGAETFEDIGFDETAGQFAAGAQVALNPVWRLGAGLGYQASSLSEESGATSESDQLQGGVALKYNPGALLLAGTVSGALGWYDTTRLMNFGGFNAAATSDHELDVLQGRLHASYVLGSQSLYYKPMLDAAVTGVDIGDVRERGAGGASLLVHGADHTVFSLSPALEIGSEWWWSNGTLVRPYVRAGFSWYSEDDVTVAASFSGAPSSVSPFTIIANTDEIQADVAAGVEMISGENSNLRLFYDGQFGDRIAVHAAGFKAGVKF